MSRRCDFNMKLSSANLASICWTILWLLCPIDLSAQVTTNCFAPPAGLMAWWTGDGDASDFAGTNNGVLMNGATATGSGLVGEAFSFDGLDSYVQLPNLVAGQSEGTVEFWFNVNTWNWTSGCCGLWLWAIGTTWVRLSSQLTTRRARSTPSVRTRVASIASWCCHRKGTKNEGWKTNSWI